MSEIHLQNIGKAQDGATPAEVAEQLITTISQSAIQDANANLTKSLESIRPGIDKGMSGLKNLLGR
ncbi:MAG TPA: hypothetical protein VFT64_03275 [Rickettsiales bacterium]|nr:hypothetical protein [Rickettsiales bacterium]